MHRFCLVGYGQEPVTHGLLLRIIFPYRPYRYTENAYFPQVLYFTVVETGLIS